MKKSLQNLFIGAGLSVTSMALAQPTLTAAGINPVIGDVTSVTSSTAAISPGSSGANQTWNLSITGTASTNTAVAVSSTPSGSSFPGSNIAVGTSTSAYVYYNASSTAFQYYGSKSTQGVQYYSNPEDFLHFPCTYNSTYTDAFACTYTSSTTIYRNGTVTVTADGYGTLTTPAGTFSNVMRVHLFENYRDSGNISGFASVTNLQNDEYLWFLNSNHTAIASVASLTTSVSGFNTVANTCSYANSVVTGINNADNLISSCNLFPNPTSNNLTLNINLTDAQKLSLKLYNSLGAQVGTAINTDGVQGLNDVKLDVATLPEGIYFVQISLNGVLTSAKKFIVSK